MSQNPRGSDPYDYNPDYNRLNEQYNQNGQYGQNTQYGQYGQYGQVLTASTGRAPTISILMTSTVRIRTVKTHMVRISMTRTVSSTSSPTSTVSP